MDAQSESIGRQAMLGLLRAPIEIRSYTNLLYLLLAFPLGLTYFVFLVVGLSVGLGLTLIWIGLPILLLVLLGSRGLAALERQLAIHLLGAEVPPMAPPATGPRTLWQQLGDLLTNSVTWKGMAFLLLKFPLGIATFILSITLLSLSLGLLLTPFFYTWQPPEIFFGWEADTLPRALLCGLFGLALSWISLNLFNGVAALWKALASVTLGSTSFTSPAAPAAPAPPEAPQGPEPALA
ncbi:MAG TPA: sensor domain-containing protein [Thermoanaerobaculia bacterium]|nr:sensor domain-containing protein [Thermoanaerobaculia bacterium]